MMNYIHSDVYLIFNSIVSTEVLKWTLFYVDVDDSQWYELMWWSAEIFNAFSFVILVWCYIA